MDVCIGLLVLLGGVGLLLYWLSRKGQQHIDVVETVRIRAEVLNTDDYPIEVVGESHYMAAFAAICGPATEDGVTMVVDAQLVPEDGNPFDPYAVAVVIDRLKVGHLPRDAAREYRARVGGRSLACQALITGGWDRGDGDVGNYGVRLRLAEKI